ANVAVLQRRALDSGVRRNDGGGGRRLPRKNLSPPSATSRILPPPHRRGVLTEHCGGGSGDGGAVPCRVGRVSASLSAVPAGQKTDRDGRDDSPTPTFAGLPASG